MRKWLRNNGLALAMLGLFLVCTVGQALTGWHAFNEEQREHGAAALGFAAYLGSGHFLESLAENWESEFLQMGAFAVFTVLLRQRGSPESKPMEGEEEVDREPNPLRPGAPWPVRRGGVALALYKHSLSIALLGLFVISFVLHAVAGARAHNDEARQHGGETVTALGYFAQPQFWFESFQNWQSEFLSIGALAVLAIFLREKGSPESKPVDAPHAETSS